MAKPVAGITDHGNAQRTAAHCASSLSTILQKIDERAQAQDCISVADIREVVGTRWYGPLLFVSGVVMMTPVIGDIPGVPVVLGLVVILTSIQFLAHRRKVWLPDFIMRSRVGSARVRKTIQWLEKPVGKVDCMTRPRLIVVVRHAGMGIIALMSILMALLTPILEFIPFSVTIAGLAIAAFGISVLTSDGLLALLAMGFSIITLGVTGMAIF